MQQDTLLDTGAWPEIRRVRHELKLRDLDVVRVEPLGPAFVAVTLRGDALADFVSLSFDDHVKLFFDGAAGDAPARRDYTPRRHDREARELVIEFALHGHGVASTWARTARVGQRLTVGGPRGSMIVPMACAWHLLVGDATALPAIARRLEELPEGARVVVLALAGADARRALPTRASAEVRWFDTPQALLDALRALPLPPGHGFAWGGGEAAVMAQVRALLADKGLPRQAMRVSAYWKEGVAEHHEDLA
ncbi:siderophore-interacting protein [uncultured Massilia sp.]|uniref:siderophore-interacting protein n=1 Tax=uncultured Massilia sp. TaxID=169973 RepID=UPI0025D4D4C1|nr:siderophore-interacting protein [uncultured Massilia sp.]